MKRLRLSLSVLPIVLCNGYCFSEGIPEGVKSPMTLQYSVTREDLRDNSYIDAALAVRKTLIENSIKSGKLKMSQADLDQELSRSRIRFNRRSKEPIKQEITIATDGKTLCLCVTDLQGRQILIVGKDFSFIKRSTGEAEYRSLQAVSLVEFLPFLGMWCGPVSLIKPASPGDTNNPENAPFMALVPGANSELSYIPTWVDHADNGNLKLFAGFRAAPKLIAEALKSQSVKGNSVVTLSKTVIMTTYRDLAKTGISGLPTVDRPTYRVTAKLTASGPAPSAKELDPTSLLAKGDRVSVNEKDSFYYDPNGGSLIEQANRARGIMNRENDLQDSLKKEPTGVWPAIAGLLGLIGVSAGLIARARLRKR